MQLWTFLLQPQGIAAYIQAAWRTAEGFDSWDVLTGIHPLHICAWFGQHYSMTMRFWSLTLGTKPIGRDL